MQLLMLRVRGAAKEPRVRPQVLLSSRSHLRAPLRTPFSMIEI